MHPPPGVHWDSPTSGYGPDGGVIDIQPKPFFLRGKLDQNVAQRQSVLAAMLSRSARWQKLETNWQKYKDSDGVTDYSRDWW
jgi:hypothetical protein